MNTNYDYKRKRIKFLGISFTFKTKKWLKEAIVQNIELNKTNLSYQIKTNKNILFIVSNLMEKGGIETRLFQYINQLTNLGWNCYILSENNKNKDLNKFINFYLNFDAKNFDDCLNEIIDKYNIKTIEFQFKNPKILKNLNLKNLKKKATIGYTIHNTGIKNQNLINNFNYKIFVSKFMYENHYRKISNPTIIQNQIEIDKYINVPSWEYKNQKTALLISRISQDKLASIECFIQYCIKNNIDFLIAGKQEPKKNIKEKILKKYNLNENIFIGNIDTIDYLSKNIENILFVGGMGLSILEALFLNFPCFCCNNYKAKSYSFITKNNIQYFDNFTINKNSLIVKNRKKEYYLDLEDISKYQQRDFIIKNRNINSTIQNYIETIKNNV